ncbi:LOW QUALITY PROTEIN: low-density lipoprotein receptor class A domain-containing protein 2 [Castor canadensis]|uniref:LOW QUALITY PROTEIN: low-density lipoprotein receptor class A domain-containing protein 2 n=1 Tax=Castor canadensis TaxID=51338 RepID=A0AC58N698_CASCN
MAACLLQLPLRLLLLGMAALTTSAVDTAELVAACGGTWRGDALLLRSHAASRSFYFVTPDTDCGLWARAAAPGDRIRFQFRFFLVYSLEPANASSSAPPAQPCAPGSFLQFYEGPPGAPRPLGAPLCGLTIPAPVTSSGPFLGLRLVTRGRQPRVDFVGEVTSFRLGPCGTYFRCRNGRCIPLNLVCDRWGMDNCGDSSDQSPWPPANCRGPSPLPNQTGSTDDDTSEPLTPSPTLETTGSLQTAAQRSLPAGWDTAQQNLEESQFRGMALASSLLLASAGLLMGLLWCCCSPSRPVWKPWAISLSLKCGAACNICYLCPARVAPGGLWPSQPASQHQGDIPKEVWLTTDGVGSKLSYLADLSQVT